MPLISLEEETGRLQQAEHRVLLPVLRPRTTRLLLPLPREEWLLSTREEHHHKPSERGDFQQQKGGQRYQGLGLYAIQPTQQQRWQVVEVLLLRLHPRGRSGRHHPPPSR